ncbi:Cytochrome b5-like heme/steroid binding domain [Pseudocohnilembus persalinus]|uniref:Cytochrome b5-like heme/steroid binding domain n=1 Tax=Pseudocohnilembus persalinus TaxID=266149 RepID=A0A0V0QK47_PSEPJ|nr:Cytochrome b5-like heme/steroid binding domain [Pseudocohnilembus persalinus]|eukprot:KRX02685.1 Cytochrome b5-like heme/steroid binding domain [Pseudocohnilembus persalinus]
MALQCDDGEVIIDGLCQNNDISELSSKATISDKVELQWEISENQEYIYFLQKIQAQTWSGLGFGVGTIKTDTIYSQITEKGGQYIFELYEGITNGDNEPNLDSFSQKFIKLLGYKISDKQTILKFKRLMKPSTGQYEHLRAGHKINANIVISNHESLSIDDSGNNRWQFVMKLSNDQKSVQTNGLTQEFMDWHITLLVISWGFLIDISIIIVRNFKSFTYAILIHGFIQLYIDFSTIIIVFLTYVIAHNNVYDVSSLDHPGGLHLINVCIGRDIDCFLYGGYSLETSNRLPHQHSLQSEIWLQNHLIGSLFDQNDGFIEIIGQQLQNKSIQMNSSQDNIKPFIEYQDDVQNSLQEQKYSAYIINEEKLSKTTSRFDFKLKFQGLNVKIQQKNLEIEQMGRHFSIKVQGQNTKRCYTIIQSLSKWNTRFRQNLLTIYENNFQTKILKNGDQDQEEHNSLPIVIKKYDYQYALSKQIHENKQKLNFEIQGPQGLGLRLNKNNQGNFFIFCAGTGILPFMDLLNFFLNKAIFLAAKEILGSSKKAEEFTSLKSYEIEEPLKNFTLKVYASFNSQEDFIGKDIIEPLQQINDKFNLKICNLTLRFSDKFKSKIVKTVDQRFDKQFIQTEFSKLKINYSQDQNDLQQQKQGQVERVWICGPPTFQKIIPEAIQNFVDENKIEFI